VLDSTRLRRLLAVDAVATALAGLLVYARPGWLGVAVRAVDAPAAGTLSVPRVARRIGLAVAVFGATKGLVYAAVLARGGPADAPQARNGEGRTSAGGRSR